MPQVQALLGESDGIAAVRSQAGRLGELAAAGRRLPPVLILGETGTGKGLLARTLHAGSARRQGPFVDVNCAAIPETILEAELFGVERGAFTDARESRQGLLQAAHGGTLFLDEIGLLPAALQTKLLKAVEERTVRRLGSTRVEAVDAWIITATNEDLTTAIAERRFREDLYHRLAGVTLRLPPLRARSMDILLLANHFLAEAGRSYGLEAKSLTAGAQIALLAYRWPGNVRGLANVLERAALLSAGPEISAAALELPETDDVGRAGTVAAGVNGPFKEAMAGFERTTLLGALREAEGNVALAAKRLGVPRTTLRYRLAKLGLGPSRHGPVPTGGPKMSAASDQSPTESITGLRPSHETRRLALLIVRLAPEGAGDSATDRSRMRAIREEKIEGFGGAVQEYAGIPEPEPSAIVAVFGLEPVEDAPQRAALAALAIRTAAASPIRGGVARVGATIHVVEATIHPAVAGAQIDDTELAAAIVALDPLASSREIIVTPEARFALARRFLLEPLREAAAGSERQAQLRRLVGLRAAPPFGRQPLSPFVVREAELAVLGALVDNVVRGHGRAVNVMGDPGVGKSRLLYEFQRRLTGLPFRMLEARCVSYGDSVPYLPLQDVIRELAGANESHPPAAVAEKLRELALPHEESVPYLLSLLGNAEQAAPPLTASPARVKTLTFDAFRRVLLQASRRQPLLVAVEDLHWIDATSEECLAAFVEVIAGAPILLLTTSRPGYHPPWLGKSFATQVTLPPLPPEASRAVVRAIVGHEDVPDGAVETIVTKAEGNPFFLEELCHVVQERQGSAVDLPVPDTVQAVLRARMDRLPPEARQLLQAAGVLGRAVPSRLLATVWGAGLPLDDHLADLVRLEFLYEGASADDRTYVFKHALTQEVAYETLQVAERARLHEAAGIAIESTYAERLEEHYHLLASHFARSPNVDKALHYLRRAGAKDFGRGASAQAAAWLSQALAVLDQSPRTRQRAETVFDVELALSAVYGQTGKHADQFECTLRAERLADELGDRSRLGMVLGRRASHAWRMGQYRGAIDAGQRALEVAKEPHHISGAAIAHHYLGLAYRAIGDYARSSHHTRLAVEGFDPTLPVERFNEYGWATLFPLCGRALNLVDLGRFAEARATADTLLHRARLVRYPYAEFFALGTLAYADLVQGEATGATRLAEQALQLTSRTDMFEFAPWALMILGSAHLLGGGVERAVSTHEDAVSSWTAMGGIPYLSEMITALGHATLASGRIDRARDLAAQALEVARAHGECPAEAQALHLAGDVHVQRGEFTLADDRYREARSLAEELGTRPFLARCDLATARLHRQSGRAGLASTWFNRAAKTFRQLEMTFAADAAELERSG